MKKLAAFLFMITAIPALAYTSNDGTIVHLQIVNCNNNSICEPSLGENYQGCPLDCQPPTPPPVPPSGGIAPPSGGGGSHFPPMNPPTQTLAGIALRNIIVTVTTNSATVSWDTLIDTLSSLSWGRTSDLEGGTISEVSFGRKHKIQIDNLSPATRYFFRITSGDRQGNSDNFGPSSFVTLSAFSFPQNIRNFHFSLQARDILLTWKNSPQKDFKSVRILRSEDFYPINPNSGKIIYEGIGTSYLDTHVNIDTDYFYSAFAENTRGDFSSGALIHLRLRQSGPTNLGSKSGALRAPLSNSSLEWAVSQNDVNILPMNNVALIKIDLPIKVTVFTENLASDTSEAILNVEDENEAGIFYSYLLRKLGDGNGYEGNIGGYTKAGEYHFSISVLNLKGEESSRSVGIMEVKTPSFWDRIWAYILSFFSWLWDWGKWLLSLLVFWQE